MFFIDSPSPSIVKKNKHLEISRLATQQIINVQSIQDDLLTFE